MSSSNFARTHQYLQTVASRGPFENVANFYAPEIVIQEFPNRIAPQGRVRRAVELRAAYEQGCKILQSQFYAVHRIFESGDEVVAELEWTGILAVPVMNLPAGSEMRAFVAMFLTFRNGKIVSQRNYDCYPPFDTPSVSSPVQE
jgi:ketosteroid isomerase-like protein